MTGEQTPPLVRFDFRSGAQRGTHLALYPRCLVHRGDSHLETVQLARVAALRGAFERDTRRLGWGVALLVIAVILLAIAGPLGSFAGHAATDVSSGSAGVARALYNFFRVLEGIAAILPAAALATVLGGAALGVFGWRGATTLTLDLGGNERVYSVDGRDGLLLDFAELASERLIDAARS